MRCTWLLAAGVPAVLAAPAEPHLAQAWQAQSSGDGLPGKIGLESYLYEEEVHKGGPPDGLRGHVFDYGASCKKIEVDSNDKHFYSGVYYIKCDAVNCCKGADSNEVDIKKWDIARPGLLSKVQYLGTKDTTELNDKPVKDADVWSEHNKLPGITVNYTYFVTANGTDVITHRIEFEATKVQAGVILYGDFKVQHNITDFRKVFDPPAECKKPNVLTCPSDMVKSVEKQYFKRSAMMKGIMAE